MKKYSKEAWIDINNIYNQFKKVKYAGTTNWMKNNKNKNTVFTINGFSTVVTNASYLKEKDDWRNNSLYGKT